TDASRFGLNSRSTVNPQCCAYGVTRSAEGNTNPGVAGEKIGCGVGALVLGNKGARGAGADGGVRMFNVPVPESRAGLNALISAVSCTPARLSVRKRGKTLRDWLITAPGI